MLCPPTQQAFLFGDLVVVEVYLRSLWSQTQSVGSEIETMSLSEDVREPVRKVERDGCFIWQVA